MIPPHKRSVALTLARPLRRFEGPLISVLWIAASLGLGLLTALICSGCVTIPGPWPTPGATRTPTQGVPKPTPGATRTPRPPAPFHAAEGSAGFEIDLAGFVPRGDGLDYYAAATLLWSEPPPGRDLPTTPALELSIRGTSRVRCLASPCGPTALGLVARWSSNVDHDSVTADHREHCGAGVTFSQRLPIGPDPLVPVRVEWRAGQVLVSTPLASWATSKGAASPGFGLVYTPLPRPGGVGWARSPWSLQEWGGSVRLVDWQGVSGAGVGNCP